MFRILFVVFTLCAFCSQASEINYNSEPWAAIRARAAAEHKYIFVDCYTDWCGWCKVMDKETMTDPAVVSLINENFIAVKMEMEHGEGVLMTMKYHVSGFPSFLFFSPDGNYTYQAAGYQKTPEFTAMLKGVLDGTKRISATGFSPSLDLPHPAFYANAFAENGKKVQPSAEEVIAYLDKQTDLLNEVNWAIIGKFSINQKYDQYFLDHVADYRRLYGSAIVNGKLNTVLGAILEKANRDQDEKLFANLIAMIDKYMGSEAAASKIYCRVAFYKATKNWTKYAAAATDFIALNGYVNPTFLHGICKDITDNATDKQLLKKASGWMKEILDKEVNYPFLETYASLLWQTGKPKEAKRIATQAIETGKKAGVDVTHMEDFLKKVNVK